MSQIEGYIKREDRKNILLLCDDIRMHSGIATMAREFVLGTAHQYNWFNLGAALKHPEVGKVMDLSADVNKRLGIEDADVKVMPNNGYGDANIIRQLIKKQKPDAIFIFTDPRYWIWLFEIEREIRSKIPIFWLNIWDDYPAPMYNKNYYNSVDLLMAISKQTKNINEIVLGEDAKNKVIEYVPHGIDENTFHPVDTSKEDFVSFKNSLFNNEEKDFVVFYNSRNIHRKHASDSILAYRMFCDKIGKEAAKRCAFVMHTQVSDNNGTDLRAVKDALTDPEYVNIYFSADRITPEQMNLLYNSADVTLLMSSNEGWGLSLTESLMSGTMIIANTTGGMQDQMRFTDENGEWINFSADFPSNHRGTYKEHGEWAEPIYPASINLAGSPLTPYIYDDRCNPEDAAEALLKVYNLDKEDRKQRGLAGRDWVTSEESQMSSKNMCKNIARCMEKGFENFTPRSKFDLIKIEDRPSKYVQHKLSGY